MAIHRCGYGCSLNQGRFRLGLKLNCCRRRFRWRRKWIGHRPGRWWRCGAFLFGLTNRCLNAVYFLLNQRLPRLPIVGGQCGFLAYRGRRRRRRRLHRRNGCRQWRRYRRRLLWTSEGTERIVCRLILHDAHEAIDVCLDVFRIFRPLILRRVAHCLVSQIKGTPGPKRTGYL